MSYVPETINISLFKRNLSNPVIINPEELISMDLSVNSYESYDRCTIKSYSKGGLIKDYLVTGVEKVGETEKVIIINLGSDVIKCSPSRMIMLSDGSYKMASEITKSDQLMGVTNPVSIVCIKEGLLTESINVYDLVTDPECNNYLLKGGVFIGKLKEVSEEPKTLKLKV